MSAQAHYPEAAARVAKFCDEWEQASNYDPNVIYTLGRLDGDHALLVSDLRALLKATA